MEDRELIKKIKLLKDIKPGHDWVDLTRRDLLGAEEPRLSWLTLNWQPALTGLALSLALVGGLLGLIHFGQEPVLVEEEETLTAEYSPLMLLEDSLVSLKGQIVDFKEQISERNTGSTNKSQQALEIQEVVNNIRELTRNIEEVDREKVLASLSDEIEKAGEEVKMVFLESELNDLKDQAEKGLLSEEKMLELSEVDSLYQSEDYEGAFWRLMELIN